MKQQRYIKRFVVFLIPVVIGYGLLEWGARTVDTKFDKVSTQLRSKGKEISVLALGTSQMETGLNPEWMSESTVNIASTYQHHDTDLKVYEQLKVKLPELKIVVLELSFGHFHIPHNADYLWKKSLFLNYYGININDRPIRFYDYLLFNSAPGYFKRKILDQYIYKNDIDTLNEYGFAFYRSVDLHRNLRYDKEKIDSLTYSVSITDRTSLLNENVELLKQFISKIVEDGKKVIICKFPLYGPTIRETHPTIISSRDSVLNKLLKRNKNVRLLDLENSQAHFTYKHFLDHNHLNPSGARIFTRKLDSVVNELLND